MPRQEIYSDELFLDFGGVRDALATTGSVMRAAILMETGLPRSDGFGSTKTLANLANHLDKTADGKPRSHPTVDSRRGHEAAGVGAAR